MKDFAQNFSDRLILNCTQILTQGRVNKFLRNLQKVTNYVAVKGLTLY